MAIIWQHNIIPCEGEAVAVKVVSGASTGIALTTGRLLSAAASDNATNVKASAGTLFYIKLYSAASALRYLKLYDKATAPTSADTPFLTQVLQPNANLFLDWYGGRTFLLGLGFRLTTGVLDNDAGALTAGDVLAMNVEYV